VRITLCTALAQGGIGQYSYGLACALQAAGVDVTQLIYEYPEYDLEAFPHPYRLVKKLQLAISRRTRLTSPMRNLRVMLQESWAADIVHFQWSLGARTDRLHIPVLRRLNKPIVYTAHDVLPHDSNVMSLEHCHWLYHHADALFVHGENLKRLLTERFDVDPSLVHVIPHGNYNFISDVSGPWTRARARESLGLSEDDCTVLFFGLIREYKGIDTLLEACRIVKERGLHSGRRLKLLLAGRVYRDHWQEGGYARSIEEAGLSDTVKLHLEHISMQDIARFFNAADVVAVPYKRGSQSGVLRLAYSFGKPAVATSVGSLSELPAADLTRFVAPEEPEAFAVALADLLNDPAAARELGQRARTYADTELSWERIAATTRAVYASLGARR